MGHRKLTDAEVAELIEKAIVFANSRTSYPPKTAKDLSVRAGDYYIILVKISRDVVLGIFSADKSGNPPNIRVLIRGARATEERSTGCFNPIPRSMKFRAKIRRAGPKTIKKVNCLSHKACLQVLNVIREDPVVKAHFVLEDLAGV